MTALAWIALALLSLVLVGVLVISHLAWRYWNERWDALCRELGRDPAEERQRLGMPPPRGEKR